MIQRRAVLASSMADLALIGEELFDRIRSISARIVPGGWSAQPQDVRDATCILFAMVRNRTTSPEPDGEG